MLDTAPQIADGPTNRGSIALHRYAAERTRRLLQISIEFWRTAQIWFTTRKESKRSHIKKESSKSSAAPGVPVRRIYRGRGDRCELRSLLRACGCIVRRGCCARLKSHSSPEIASVFPICADFVLMPAKRYNLLEASNLLQSTSPRRRSQAFPTPFQFSLNQLRECSVTANEYTEYL